MSSTIDISATITATANGALSQGQLLVRDAAGTFSPAGVAAQADGVAVQDIADGASGPVKLLSTADTVLVLADGSGVSNGDTIYGAASGVGSSTQGTGAFAVGVAWEDAGADELFEMRYKPGYTAGS